MHARAVPMPPARALAPATAGGRARIANAHSAGSRNLSGRASNVKKKLGDANARVILGSGPRRAARRGPAPARAELTDAQDAGEMQKVVARRVALISESEESLVAQCAALGISTEGGKGELVDRLLRNELGNEAFILYNGGRTGFLGGAPPVPTPPKPAAATSTPAASAATPARPARPATPAVPAPPAADPAPPASAATPPTPPSESAAPAESAQAAQAAAELAEAEAQLEAFEAANAAMLDAEQAQAQAQERAAASAAALEQARSDREREKREEADKIAAMLERAEAEKTGAETPSSAPEAPASETPVVSETPEAPEAPEAPAAAAAPAAPAAPPSPEERARDEQAARDRAAAAAARAAAATAELERLTKEEAAFEAAERVADAEAKVKVAEAAAAAAAEAEAAAAAEEEEKEGFAPLSPDGFAVPEEAETAPQPERAAPSDVEKEQKAAADLAAAAAKVQAAAEARARAIALADEVKRKEEEEKRAKEEAKRAAEEAEKRAAEEAEAARLRAEEEAMERELAEIAAAQAQALAEIEARQNADQAELEAKVQAKADKNAAAAAERAAAAQAQAEADAAIAAAEADALSVPGSGTAADADAPPAAPSEVPVDLTANATEEDIAARTRRLGANVTSIGCAFGVWAPHAEKMTLLIYGGAPDPLRGYDVSQLPVPARYEMYRDPNNNANWRMEVQQVGAGWRYAFEVTMPGGHTFTRRDPWARETDFESDVCFVVDPGQFRFSKFERPKHDELVMYQCHVGTFTGRGDPELGTPPGTFVALTRKLDHIKNMGFNCLQLLPHTEFGGAWGYNPRLMHAVHGPYGDSLEFAELVEAAHKRGIAVMVDVALHHGAANGNSLWEFDGWSQDGDGGIYFERAGDTGWGQGFAFWKEEVQEYLSATVDTWLGEYNCDGVRVDSAHSMPPDFVRRVTNRARNHEGRFVVVEHSPEGGHVPGELGADACWLFSSCDNCAGMTNYWKGNMERLEAVAVVPEGYHSNHSFVKFPLGSHDVIGKRPGHTHDLGHWASRFGGRGEWRARASMRLWWGVAAAGVGIPMMFMGTETHQDGHWHTEPEAEMDWSTIARGGEKWAKEGMACVKAANEMRVKHWSLTRGTTRVLHKDHENGIIVVERHYEGMAEDGKTKMNERLIVVVNDGDGQWDAEQTYGVNVGPRWGDELGRFEEIFNSQDEAFGGWPGSGNAERGVIEQEGDILPIAIPKLGVVVLKQVSGPSRDPDLVLAELSAGAAASISALGR